MSRNPYKDYYDAMNSNDEWKYERAEEARKRIEEIEERYSWTGERPNFDEPEYEFGPGA